MIITSSTISECFTYLEYSQDCDVDPYNGSPIKLFKDMSSKKKGSAFEKLITEILIDKGITVTKPNSTDFDRLVDNKKIEIKGSLGWVTDGVITHYRFQQIRESQDYDYVLFAFFTPDGLIMKIASKSVVMEKLSYQDENGYYPHNQHGGKRVNSGTFCVDCLPEQLDWMEDINTVFDI